ncbi:MAG: hypothetical protein ACREBG_30310 [Pyrinomonadaceae bacterium]
MFRRVLTLSILLPCVLFVTLTVVASLRSQKKTPQVKFDKSQYPIVEESQSRSSDATERAKIEIKARRFRMALPAVSNPNITVAK